MKIKRSKLRKIVREVVETKIKKKFLKNTSKYESLTNSERAAYIKEGPVLPGPWGEKQYFEEEESESDTMADIYYFPKSEYEDEEDDLSPEEMEILQTLLNAKRKMRSRSSLDGELDKEFEDYLRGIESGNLVDLFDEEN